jgi:hypothetical protein
LTTPILKKIEQAISTCQLDSSTFLNKIKVANFISFSRYKSALAESKKQVLTVHSPPGDNNLLRFSVKRGKKKSARATLTVIHVMDG